MAVQYYEGVGRRKESTARVRVMAGSGQFTVNEKPAEAYFTRLGDMQTILAPIEAVGENPAQLDLTVFWNVPFCRMLTAFMLLQKN